MSQFSRSVTGPPARVAEDTIVPASLRDLLMLWNPAIPLCGRYRESPDYALPVELRADLTDARITRVGHNSKAPIANIPAGINELCVVENIEKFETDVESEVLFNGGSLQYAEIGIVESGTVEESPVRGSKCPQNTVLNEGAGRRSTGVRIFDRRRLRRNKITPCVVLGRAIGIRVPRIQTLDLADDIRHVRGRAARE